MRGKARHLVRCGVKGGITPAYAGKRHLRRRSLPAWRDHPRVCGEKFRRSGFWPMKKGSPPRMRGKAPEAVHPRAGRWITPAYAGKSQGGSVSQGGGQDHPRVCGEKWENPEMAVRTVGSPPRMRGKARRCRPDLGPRGITPAYAGKRLKRSHRIGHFSCILCLFHSVLHRASASGGSRAGPCAPPCLPAQNAVPV